MLLTSIVLSSCIKREDIKVQLVDSLVDTSYFNEYNALYINDQKHLETYLKSDKYSKILLQFKKKYMFQEYSYCLSNCPIKYLRYSIFEKDDCMSMDSDILIPITEKNNNCKNRIIYLYAFKKGKYRLPCG